MNHKIKNTPIWKLGLRFSIVFFIISAIIKIIMSVLMKDFSDYVKTEQFRNYMIGLGVFSMIYGFLMASLQKRKNK
ncbi:hypothetical protein [Pseudofulvibacter geojedonensis]|uniref:hypothetical protein n=1 Tax=Pseudofulvibacter geojedonensis TaxID=1123758 RepID=UPI00366F9716